MSKIIYHTHHIIPRHMGGTDDPTNLIRLTVEEHAEAHRKLYEEHGLIEDKLAWQGLSGMISKQDIISNLMSAKSSGSNNPMHGRSAVTEKNLRWYTDGETTIYVSEGTQPDGFVLGRTTKKFRGPHPKEHKQKISNSLKGNIPPNRLKVIAPNGKIFDSIKRAANYNNMTVSQFRYRLVYNGDWIIQR